MNEERNIILPSAVAAIYDAVTRLKAEFPFRSFTPDGHLVGHLGEVIAAKESGLRPYTVHRLHMTCSLHAM